jgi:acetyl esterase/lipase
MMINEGEWTLRSDRSKQGGLGGIFFMISMSLLALALEAGESIGQTNEVLTPRQRLESPHHQAIEEARQRFARERGSVPSHGLYEDVRVKNPDTEVGGTNLGPCQIILSNRVTHVLAQDSTEPLTREALKEGRFYVADDWLCDPTGFGFGAVNNLGVFNLGDAVPILGKTTVMGVTPLAATLRLFHNGALVRESTGTNMTFEAKESGAYRIEAWLTVDGEERPWIYSSAVYLKTPGLGDISLPSMAISQEVEARKDIVYRDGLETDAGKHKLDIYVPKGKPLAPVFFFIHGGAWKTGDRSYYPPLGNRYAREGFVTVVPSYRLAPKNPHPAQIEDVAAAFAWTVRHIAEEGGDTNRIYVGGHSAGGHLAALLALDESYLARHQLSPKLIHGVLALSGVYDLSFGDYQDSVFGKDPKVRRAASPLFHAKAGAPPFLVSYCQWDYFTLPAQARQFYRALRAHNVKAELAYIPQENHLSEMINVTKPEDPIVTAAVRFMK